MLGPFSLTDTLATGGTATVWRAVYSDGRPGQVALKVLTEERATRPEDLSAFRREVRAAARLNHPNIASVLDYGTVPDPGPGEVRQSGLSPGAPWLAMELGSGTLHPHCGKLAWPQALEALEALLSALAHAHAHGLVHRDVKPRNLLRVGERWKLGDFGLAHVLPGADDTRIIGTPSTMAPEHFAGAWRDHGPWTDLYSVGCLAWHLVCGRTPFHAARTPLTLREAHNSWPVPELEPTGPVPPGLEAWIRRLMAKRPQDRPAFAADALHALRALGPAQPLRSQPVMLGAADAEMATAELDLAPADLPQALAPTESAWPPPPFAPDWRSDPRLPPPVGLGLVALRARPVVGRQSERDLLWRALGQVVSGEGLRVAGLHGPLGSGRSALAGWLAIEAHARGQARVFQARFGPGEGGLREAVLTSFQLQGLDTEACVHRLARLLRRWNLERPDHDARVLASLLHAPPPGRAARFAAEEQRAALVRVLAAWASERPVLLILDEAGAGSAGAALVHLLRQRGALRILTLWTAPEDRLPADLSLHIGPLPEADLDLLLRGVLGLSPELSVQVQDRAQGSPAFALQLVEAWVEQRALEESPSGLALRAEHTELPPSLRRLWRARLEALLAELPAADARALEVAALMDRRPPVSAWQEICAHAGWAPSEPLLPTLLQRELLSVEDGGLHFPQSWLREALREHSQAQGRWPIQHATLAAWLRDAGPELAGPRGLHHLEAGDWASALEDLCSAQERAIARGQLTQAALLDPPRTRALRAWNPPPEHPAWARDLLLRAQLAFGRGDQDEGLKLARQAVQAARRLGNAGLEARALLEGGRLLHRRGELSRARRWLRRGVKAALVQGDRSTAAHCRELLANTLAELGELAAAEQTLQSAWEDYEATGETVGVGSVHLGLSFLCLARGGLDDAEAHAQVALEHCTGVGAERMRCAALGVLGDVARARGEPEAARRWFQRALRLHAGSGRLYATALTWLNLALTELEAGQDTAAQAALEQVQRFQQGQGAGNLQALTTLAQAVVSARAGAADTDQRFSRARIRLEQTGQVHRDIHLLATLLAQACEAQGWTQLGQRARDLADAQSERLPAG